MKICGVCGTFKTKDSKCPLCYSSYKNSTSVPGFKADNILWMRIEIQAECPKCAMRTYVEPLQSKPHINCKGCPKSLSFSEFHIEYIAQFGIDFSIQALSSQADVDNRFTEPQKIEIREFGKENNKGIITLPIKDGGFFHAEIHPGFPVCGHCKKPLLIEQYEDHIQSTCKDCSYSVKYKNPSNDLFSFIIDDSLIIGDDPRGPKQYSWLGFENPLSTLNSFPKLSINNSSTYGIKPESVDTSVKKMIGFHKRELIIGIILSILVAGWYTYRSVSRIMEKEAISQKQLRLEKESNIYKPKPLPKFISKEIKQITTEGKIKITFNGKEIVFHPNRCNRSSNPEEIVFSQKGSFSLDHSTLTLSKNEKTWSASFNYVLLEDEIMHMDFFSFANCIKSDSFLITNKNNPKQSTISLDCPGKKSSVKVNEKEESTLKATLDISKCKWK
jgi:hypothetical protein